MDSSRWDGFEFRDDDIIISTPPKCGTTWTQMICGLLIFGSPEFPTALDRISPWLDQCLRRCDDVVADLAAQDHRRFIKTHTPLDGLPFDERVTYLCVGRDPRDVAISWACHLANIDPATFVALRTAAVGVDDLAIAMAEREPPPDRTESERFWDFVDGPADQSEINLAFLLHHVGTFWRSRDRANVVMLHYDDLKTDLAGQMRGLAARLGIDVPESAWSRLVGAATFEEMRARPAAIAPNSTQSIWLDPASFFRSGASGQWRHLVDDQGAQRYESRVRELVDDDLARWIHHGSEPMI